MFNDYLANLPLIAILRGVTPEEIVPVGRALYEAGFRVIEIPLNSPEPFESIRLLSDELGEDCLIGAGTVLTPDDVRRAADAGSWSHPTRTKRSFEPRRPLGWPALPGWQPRAKDSPRSRPVPMA